ncbi:MAG: hypothetical protein A2W22_06850 [Candidatus Levybacteria bacterium RBG_16_35_11]|nr:MAG: hypothetical protein A2W22_06850 [Candidatus Levybacteria bacterium RBG_16_35_11]
MKMANGKWQIKNRNGFTLVELIIVITIIAILSSIGIASFVESSRNASLQTVQDKVESMINVAKSRSLSQTTPVADCNGSLQGYGVLFSSNKEICLYAVCTEGLISSNPPLDCQNTVETYNLPNEISIQNPPLPGPFYFPILSNSIEGLNSPTQVIIEGFGKEKSITVNPSGVVSTGSTPTPAQ